MRTIFRSIFLAVLTISAAAQQRHVIVISLDGFPAYVLNDPAVPFPVLRRLIREGASAEGMKPVNPTVTWPNHTAIITGSGPSKHGVLYNGMPIRQGEGKPLRVEPWVPKTELVQTRTVYDAAHDAGMTTAEVDWVAIYHPPTVTWSFAEVPQIYGPVEKEMIARGVISEDELKTWSKANIAFKDEMWTRAAVHIIEQHKPNLLMYHLLTTDSVQHQYGARSLAANAALILADRQIQRILDAVDRAGIRDTTTLFVVSDHGFKAYHHLIRPNALLRERGLLRDANGIVDCDAYVVTEGGTAMVYITRESKRAAALQTMNDAFAKVPGIVKTIQPSEFAAAGYPPAGGRMADLVLVAAQDYAFDNPSTGAVSEDIPAGALRGNHGYINTDSDMNAILVAWGAGIRAGAHVGIVPNLNVAPTIARILKVNLPEAQGSAISEFLK